MESVGWKEFCSRGTREEAVVPQTEAGLVQARVARVEVLRSVWIYWTLRRLGNGLDVPGKEGTPARLVLSF